MTGGPTGKIRCDACPVLCYIADGRSGACGRYGNEGGVLVRLSTMQVELTRMYTLSATGATPASPLSVMQRGPEAAS